LGARLRTCARQDGRDEHLLVVVDQLEEVFTLGATIEERNAFFSCLQGVADDATSPLRVVASMRADFLDRCAEDRHVSTFVSHCGNRCVIACHSICAANGLGFPRSNCAPMKSAVEKT
jgi:hypothetical protein